MAIVERASTPRQRTILGTVATIPELAEREKAAAPAVVVVGEVVHVLLERGPRVLYGYGAGEKGEQRQAAVSVVPSSVVAASRAGGSVKLGGMRGGGDASPRSFTRRILKGVVGLLRAAVSGRRRGASRKGWEQ